MDNQQSVSKKTILLVEDELYIRELYARILRKEGYEVEEVDNGEDAYQKIKNTDYNLILLDVMLPKLDGLQILKNLQAEKSNKLSKIILLTNLDQSLTIADGVSYGIRAYFIKSQFPPDKLKQEVANYFAETGGK